MTRSTAQSLYGQYITLAAREGIVTETPVTFNLNSLPSDAMSNYTDFLVIAVPITSGKGDVTSIAGMPRQTKCPQPSPAMQKRHQQRNLVEERL